MKFILSKFNSATLKRLATYLTGYHSKIELNKISRNGTGVYYQVVPEDTPVNQILSFLCVMYPAGIVKTSNGFKVKNGPLLWTIRDLVNHHLTKVKIPDDENQWVAPADDTRQRWEHQVTSVEQMIERNKLGKKGHLIWIPVGMGKTLIVIDYLAYLIQTKQMPKYCVYSLPSSAIDNIRHEFNLRHFPVRLVDARRSAPIDQRGIEPYVVNLIKHDHLRLNQTDTLLKTIGAEMVFIIDEFHKTLAKTIRTSIALELTRLAHEFVGMSGTIIKDTNHDELIQWLEQVVEFEVTEKNYWVAIGAMISRRVFTKVSVKRQIVEIPMDKETSGEYYAVVPDKLGGTARHIDFREAARLSYKVVTDKMVDHIRHYVVLGEGVFVVAKNIKHQEEIRDKLIKLGIKTNQIYLFGKDSQITLTSEYNGPIKVVITTIRQSEGYTLTKFRIMITSVYFTNQATREQLEGRINRIGQFSPTIRIAIFHTGILSYVYRRYEQVRNLAEALKGFAKEVGLTRAELRM